MLATGTDTWASVGDTIRIGQAAHNASIDWTEFIAGSYDDAQYHTISRFFDASSRGKGEEAGRHAFPFTKGMYIPSTTLSTAW